MIDAQQEDAELERRVEERVAARRRDRLARFDLAALAWMVLVPSWTEDLARACEFPAKVAEVFPALRRVGLCEQSKRVFWMPDAERAQTSAFLLATLPQQSLDEHAERIARALLRSAPDLAPPLARWAELASRSYEGPAHLRTQIREALHRGEAGDALGWLESARYLDGLVSARYGAEIALSARRIELVYRLGQDRRHLASFLERKEQIAVIDRLLALDSPCWALHLLGMGGVGKTMLLRHVTVTQADHHRAIVARVDFDHLNPDFPVRRPGQLLSALAEELASHLDGDRQQSILTSFHGYVAEINEQLSAEPPPDDPLDNLRHPLFQRILDAFADLLTSLPRPPLFILDTCEELAKIDPVSAKIPGVEAMFYILERLHDRAPRLRVLLAGRRLLARGGAGWSVDPDRLSHESRQLPDPRSYLALHVLRGFTAAEVDAYLAAQAITLTAPARAALLAQCPDAGGLPGLAATVAVDDAPRYNPFDVALYAGWIQGDPDLDLATLARADADPYVELRILRRLESDDLRAVMPALTLLRRFDRAALALLFPGDQGRIDRLYRLLGEQEWTDYQSDGSGGALEINRALLPRIMAYFEHPTRRAPLDAASAQLGPLLAAALRDTRLEDCRIETIDAALRSASAAEGAALWADLERRIALGRAFSWAVRVAGRLLGEGAAAAPDGPLRVAIQATHTSAITHEQPSLDLHAAWEEIDRSALKYPDDARTPTLHARAIAGQIASARVTRKAPSREHLDALLALLIEPLPGDDFLMEQSIAAFAAAIDAALDTGVKLAIESLAPLFDRHRLALPPLAAFLTLLDARVSAAAGNLDRATALYQAALRLAIASHAERDATGYLDWTPPNHLVDRVRLEHERSVVAPQRTDDELHALLNDAAARLDGIDAERWSATMLLRRLAQGLVPGNIVDDVIQSEHYNAARMPTCEAHRATPPLLIAAAHAVAAAGDPTRALTLLDARLDAATEAGHDKPTIVSARRAQLAVMARYRIHPGALVDQLRFETYRALALSGEALPPDPATWSDFTKEEPWLGLGKAPDEAASEQPRALAERMLLNAEILALHDPDQGGRELGPASSAFINCGDSVGALIAGIAAVLALARRGSRRDVAQVLMTVFVATSYTEVVLLLGKGVLPAYAALEKSDLAAGATAIEEAPVAWREWLFRLIVCLHFARPRPHDETTDILLASALEARYGARIPAELRFDAAPSPSPTGPGMPAGTTPTKVPSSSRLQTWTINGLVVLILLAAGAGVFFALEWQQRLIEKYFHGSILVPIAAIALAIVLSLLVGTNRKDNRRFAAEVLHNFFVDLPRALLFTREAAITVEPSSGQSSALALLIARTTRFRGFPNGKPAVEIWNADLARPALTEAYASENTRLPEKLSDGINDLDGSFFAHRCVPLVVARRESMLPWEAYLRQALPPIRIASTLWLYRPVPGSPRPPSDRLPRARADITQPYAKDHWVKSLWSDQVDHASIVHAIGIPSRASIGMRVQFGPAGAKRYVDSSGDKWATLLVLQLRDVDSLVRAATDRQQVADMRELAFDAARSGTPFVLVIPALTKEDAVLLITALARRLENKTPSLDHLLSITEHLRSLLLRPKDPHAAELRELAFDITLFAAETGPLRGGKTTE
jgi:AAA ATPase-like protein